MGSGHVPLGQLLVESGRLDRTQLERALELHQGMGGRLGDAIVALGYLAEPVLLAEVARQRQVVYVELGDRIVPRQIVELAPAAFVRANRALPFALGPHACGGQLFVATAAPHETAALQELQLLTGFTVQAVLVGDRDLDRAIERHLGLRPGES
jgi:Type II secretion system (T2SS), protein E, N-terminal domain